MNRYNNVDEVYGNLIQNILDNGEELTTRNSICKRIHSYAVSFTATPLIGVRKTAWKNALREWQWFMSGSANVSHLDSKVQHWWKPWEDRHGEIKFNYSHQFRSFHGHYGVVDQVAYLIDSIKNHPYSRRAVATTWNTADMLDTQCKITNCHGTVIQMFVSVDGRLDMTMYQRSADVVCGIPHNWIQYWAFLTWLAHRTSKQVGTFTWIGGDVHIYQQHYQIAGRIADLSHSTPNTPELQYFVGDEEEPEFRAESFGLRGEYLPLLDEKVEMVV